MNNGKKWLELVNKLESSKGNKILNKLKHLAISQYTFNKNFNDLIELVNVYEKDISIWSIDNRQKLDAVQREFLRLLHNYLSSAYSLIQHTYVFRDSLKNKKFKKFYDIESKKFKIDEIMRFIQDLRTYTQHCKLPFSKASVSFKRTNKLGGSPAVGTYKQELLLDKKELLKWKNWTQPSKNFLVSQIKDIKLKELIIDYYNKINIFYKDIYKKVSLLYKKEIEEYLIMEKEIIELQKTIHKKED